MQEYRDLQDEVWPYGNNEWGRNKEKIRDFLKKRWKYEVKTKEKERTSANVKEEAYECLQWWWIVVYRKHLPMKLNRDFAEFLDEQYRLNYGQLGENPREDRTKPRQMEVYYAED